MAKLADTISRRLQKLYVENGLSTLDLARRLSSNRESVRKLIHRYGIPIRSKGAGMAAKHRP